jgi:hypothetical protein
MPSKVDPVDAPVSNKTDKNVEADVQLTTIFRDPGATAISESAPDVTKLVRKINQRLAPPWGEHELRCGRAIVLDASPQEVNELRSIFSNFVVITSNERAGLMMTFRVPEAKADDPTKKR